MSEPTVACIMLTKDRPELAARAVRCFRRQEGARCWLMIVDMSEVFDAQMAADLKPVKSVVYCPAPHWAAFPLGRIRNAAIDCALAMGELSDAPHIADAICHWDDDDYSHPNRIAEQVAFLQSSGAAVVGYNQMLFWRDANVRKAYEDYDTWDGGQAWLYTGPAHQPLGTSLCYWRSTWDQHRFDDRKHCGEDTDFLHRVGHRRVKSASSLVIEEPEGESRIAWQVPRMIATVHGANTQQDTYNGFFKGGTVEMKRCAEWDERVRMTLEGA